MSQGVRLACRAILKRQILLPGPLPAFFWSPYRSFALEGSARAMGGQEPDPPGLPDAEPVAASPPSAAGFRKAALSAERNTLQAEV